MARSGTRAVRRTSAVLAAIAAISCACSPGPVVNTGDSSARSEPATSTPSLATPANNLHLANAYDYFRQSDDLTGYYFTTPSGRWRCAILPHSSAGCRSASGSAIGVSGAPDLVANPDGKSAAPNAIVVDAASDAHFAWVRQAEYSPAPTAAKVLPFNTVLDAAGFRCNVQESAGVSCASELTAKGFTFSADGYTLQYTDVPDSTPP
ncbi:MAG: hypothetical protein QOE41_5035 [Mycobacterium sp.]|jgi:fermentation-respiration switch protein FrsA (DUF1100 family)|nr:hypothetical protein [Mycobacterium sp.]MDT5135724.1 hypothetical protein [Mycobacterium sp.]